MHINLQNDPCFCSPIVRSIVNPSIRMTTVCTNLGLGLGHNLSLSNLALICFLFTIKHRTHINYASHTTHPRPCETGALQLLLHARRCEARATAMTTVLGSAWQAFAQLCWAGQGWAGLLPGLTCFASALLGSKLSPQAAQATTSYQYI